MSDFLNPFSGMTTESPIGNPSTPNSLPATALNPGQVTLADLPPAAFDQLTKILALLQDQGTIAISNSIICQAINKGTSILKCDVSQISAGLNLHIANPKKYVKLFKSIKGNSNVSIIDDEEQKRYVIVNCEVNLFLTKQLEVVVESLMPPDLSSAQPMGDMIKISKDMRETIKSIMSGSEYVDILIKNNTPMAIYIPETGMIKFPGIKDSIDETNADLTLRSYSFLMVDSDEYALHIGKLGNDYWLLTNSKTGIIDISLFESIQEVSSENMLI